MKLNTITTSTHPYLIKAADKQFAQQRFNIEDRIFENINHNQGQIQQILQILLNLKNKINTQNRLIPELNQQNKTIEELLARFKAKNKDQVITQQRLDELTQQNNAILQQLSQYQQELRKLEQEENLLKEKQQMVLDSNKTMKDNLDTLEDLKTKIDQITLEIQKNKQLINDAIHQKTTINETMAKLQSEIDINAEKISKQKIIINQQLEEHNKLKVTYDQLILEINNLNKNIADSDVDKMKSNLSDTSIELTRLQKQNNDYIEQNQQLTLQIAQLEDKIKGHAGGSQIKAQIYNQNQQLIQQRCQNAIMQFKKNYNQNQDNMLQEYLKGVQNLQKQVDDLNLEIQRDKGIDSSQINQILDNVKSIITQNNQFDTSLKNLLDTIKTQGNKYQILINEEKQTTDQYNLLTNKTNEFIDKNTRNLADLNKAVANKNTQIQKQLKVFENYTTRNCEFQKAVIQSNFYIDKLNELGKDNPSLQQMLDACYKCKEKQDQIDNQVNKARLQYQKFKQDIKNITNGEIDNSFFNQSINIQSEWIAQANRLGIPILEILDAKLQVHVPKISSPVIPVMKYKSNISLQFFKNYLTNMDALYELYKQISGIDSHILAKRKELKKIDPDSPKIHLGDIKLEGGAGRDEIEYIDTSSKRRFPFQVDIEDSELDQIRRARKNPSTEIKISDAADNNYKKFIDKIADFSDLLQRNNKTTKQVIDRHLKHVLDAPAFTVSTQFLYTNNVIIKNKSFIIMEIAMMELIRDIDSLAESLVKLIKFNEKTPVKHTADQFYIGLHGQFSIPNGQKDKWDQTIQSFKKQHPFIGEKYFKKLLNTDKTETIINECYKTLYYEFYVLFLFQTNTKATDFKQQNYEVNWKFFGKPDDKNNIFKSFQLWIKNSPEEFIKYTLYEVVLPNLFVHQYPQLVYMLELQSLCNQNLLSTAQTLFDDPQVCAVNMSIAYSKNANQQQYITDLITQIKKYDDLYKAIVKEVY